jgi:CBS domain-containing protein
MRVVDIMTTPAITVDAEASVAETARLMIRNNISGLPVVSHVGTVMGIVTEEDLIVRNANLHLPTLLIGLYPVRGQHEYDEEVRHMLATHAREMMSEHFVSVSPDADVSDAATLMVERHANPLPVIDGGNLVGVVSRSDIIRLMVQEESGSATGPTSAE